MKSIYERVPDIHYLFNYRANESNYGEFDTNIIFCCHKINDIYWTYSMARACLEYINNNDYGDFARDENSKLYVQAQMIQNALSYYNILIDLSWQFMWFYYEDCIGKMPTKELYDGIAKKCTFDKLRYRLTLAKDVKLRDYYLNDFFANKLVIELREQYNYMKHRGTFYFSGLGMNGSTMMGNMNNYEIPLISRRELKIDSTYEVLVEFDVLYFDYISNIIKIYMPDDFLTYNNLIESYVNYWSKYKEQLVKWNEKNKRKY